MRSKWFILLAFLGTGAVLAPTAAQSEPKRQCYRFGKFQEYVDLIVNDAVSSHILVYGRWVQAGVGSGGVAGSFERNEGATGRRFSLAGTIRNVSGVIAVSLDATPNGSWALRGIGHTGNIITTSGSSFQKVKCGNPLPAGAEHSRFTTDP